VCGPSPREAPAWPPHGAFRRNGRWFSVPGEPDAGRAKEFYGRLGWRLDADRASGDEFRIVQFTPPGSDCSIQFGTNITLAAPGSAQSLYLIVSDIQAARDELVALGVERLRREPVDQFRRRGHGPT
jgi:hypothetical protein